MKYERTIAGYVAGMWMAIAAVAADSTHAREAVASATPEPVPSAADPAGRMTGYQLARRYSDVLKIDGKNVPRTIEYGFDYDKRTTVRRTYDDEGRLIAEDAKQDTLRANDAESERMIELVRTHPALGALMDKPGLHVHAGGFVVRQAGDPYCNAESRCLRVIVSAGDGSIPVLHAIVDLVSDRVVYPFVNDESTFAHKTTTREKSS